MKKKGVWPYAFVVYEPAERNFHIPACREHKTRKKVFFHWLHFFFTWLFLYYKQVTRFFSSTSNIAWQFSYQWIWQRAILPQTQIHMYANLVEQNLILTLHCPDLFVYTSSSLAFFLMQWVKSTVIFPLRPCFKFSCGQELFQQFLRDLSAKRNSLICCRIQQKIHETHKICLWL